MPADPLPVTDAPTSPRRATVTFLFTDIESSTRLWEESPAMFERVEEHFRVLRSAVEQSGGEVFTTLGDGVAAAFGSVDAAVRAAMTAQRQMPPTGLAVRMGIHTGDAERAGRDFRGRPVNRAARIMAVGHGGQILLSDVSAALARATGGSGAELVDLGTHRLRDLTEPERLWQVVHPDLPRRFPPVRGVDSVPNNLPAQRSTLVGRDADVDRVRALAEQHRVVTLTGVGGVGKTRLAVHAAADLLPQFARVWFVELAGVGDPDDVADTIARAVGVAAVVDPLAAATAMLAGEPTLLVVDNCEHVLAAVADVVDTLTSRCPRLSVIATSREDLGIDGEQVVPVSALHPATTAAELFRHRAGASGADVAAIPSEAVVDLCRRLDGLPLAIELAAARVAALGIAVVAEGLDERLDVLRATRRRADDRHGTMRATIEWSYRLLDDDERALFLALSVFPSGAELDAVHHVAASLGMDPASATELVTSLVHRSMLTPDTSADRPRYRMLETMRTFALEELDARGDRVAALDRLAEWMTALTDLSYADPCNAAVERCAIRLEREADNWRDAMLHAGRMRSPDLAASLCGPSVAYFLLGRHDLADVVRPLLDLCVEPHHRRAVLCALIVSSSGATEPGRMKEWADEISAIDETDRTGLGVLMQWLALAWRGDFATSVELCANASVDESLAQGTRDMLLGIAVLDRFSLTGATDDPRGLVDRALEVADRSDVAIHRVTCLLGSAWAVAAADPDRALDLVRHALADIPYVPAITRLTLPGSAARLLSGLDPAVAARGLLEQLDAMPTRRSFVDLIPHFYGAALLQRLGNDEIGSTLATVAVSPIAPYLSMMDVVDLARRASAMSTPGSLTELEADVRAALAVVADAAT